MEKSIINNKENCKEVLKDQLPNFKYSISNILKNLYDAFSSNKITLEEKSEIKNLIFSKNSAITNIFEDLKNPLFFKFHLKNLKRIVNKNKEKNEENFCNQNMLLNFDNSKNFSIPLARLNFKKFQNSDNGEITNFQNLNHSLLMDSNESIMYIEKTNQNLFSEEEAENLSTTLGLELINESTNPSTPLNARKINNKNNKNPKSKCKQENIKRKESKSSIIKASCFNCSYGKLDLEEIKLKIIQQKNYRSDEENLIKLY